MAGSGDLRNIELALHWISEENALPRIGQMVLLATPRQARELWDIETATLQARHEDVVARPVKRGSLWPTDYYWGYQGRGGNSLITGNGWWARLDAIPLPPRAEHASHNGYTFVRQIGDVFVQQGRRDD